MKHACKSGSLYQLLNRTRTSCGARLLRASILQPLRDEPTITARLDAVQELVESADLSFGVGAWLKQTLPRDLDKMCIGLGVTGTSKGGVGANVTTSRRLSAMVQAIVSLRKLLEALPALAEALAPSAGALLTSIRALVEDRRFSEILGRIHEVIDEEAQAGSNTFMNHIQCCFAVKASGTHRCMLLASWGSVPSRQT